MTGFKTMRHHQSPNINEKCTSISEFLFWGKIPLLGDLQGLSLEHLSCKRLSLTRMNNYTPLSWSDFSQKQGLLVFATPLPFQNAAGEDGKSSCCSLLLPQTGGFAPLFSFPLSAPPPSQAQKMGHGSHPCCSSWPHMFLMSCMLTSWMAHVTI